MTVLQTTASDQRPSIITHPVIRSMHAILPAKTMTGEQVDQWIGEAPGWTTKKTGVALRHVAEDQQTVASMGADVVRQILDREGLTFSDIDAIVVASASRDQFLPSTAALVSHELGPVARGLAAFDIDASCLSFVLALDLMNRAMATGMYRRIVLVSAEMPTRGLDPAFKESAALFGDAAVAAILESGKEATASSKTVAGNGAGERELAERKTDGPLISRIGHAKFETFGEGAHFTEVKVGTSYNPTTSFHDYEPNDFKFMMQGSKAYQLAAREFPGFVDRFLAEANMAMGDFDYVIPHQASKPAVELLARRLGVAKGHYAQDYARHGNTVAASIPLSLFRAREEGRVQRVDNVLLLGTAAGLTLGAMAVEI